MLKAALFVADAALGVVGQQCCDVGSNLLASNSAIRFSACKPGRTCGFHGLLFSLQSTVVSAL